MGLLLLTSSFCLKGGKELLCNDGPLSDNFQVGNLRNWVQFVMRHHLKMFLSSALHDAYHLRRLAKDGLKVI